MFKGGAGCQETRCVPKNAVLVLTSERSTHAVGYGTRH